MRKKKLFKHDENVTSFHFSHQGAAQLAKDVSEKLEEAEEQCKDSLQSEWEECRPCLEDACKTFYTSTCRRGFASFRSKVWQPSSYNVKQELRSWVETFYFALEHNWAASNRLLKNPAAWQYKLFYNHEFPFMTSCPAEQNQST